MGDVRRFDLFGELISSHFERDCIVADVAGGKGMLQAKLRQCGFKNVVTFDKRKGRKDRPTMRYEYRWFDHRVKGRFDLLVGMHCDEATDVIITEAASRKADFVICPCCVKPSAVPFYAQHNFTNWMLHLIELSENLGFKVTTDKLKMIGKNSVIIGKRPGSVFARA